MSRKKTLLAAVLLSLCACGKNTGKTEINPEYAGRYELIRIEGGSVDEGIPESEMDEIRKYDLNCTLIMNEDGTAVLNIFGDEESYQWSGSSLTDPETDKTITFEADGNILTVTDDNTSQALVFSKSASPSSD